MHVVPYHLHWIASHRIASNPSYLFLTLTHSEEDQSIPHRNPAMPSLPSQKGKKHSQAKRGEKREWMDGWVRKPIQPVQPCGMHMGVVCDYQKLTLARPDLKA